MPQQKLSIFKFNLQKLWAASSSASKLNLGKKQGQSKKKNTKFRVPSVKLKVHFLFIALHVVNVKFKILNPTQHPIQQLTQPPKPNHQSRPPHTHTSPLTQPYPTHLQHPKRKTNSNIIRNCNHSFHCAAFEIFLRKLKNKRNNKKLLSKTVKEQKKHTHTHTQRREQNGETKTCRNQSSKILSFGAPDASKTLEFYIFLI